MSNNLFNVVDMVKSIPQIIEYLPITIGVTLVAMFGGLFIGLFTALFRIYKTPVLLQLSWFYISFIRGTPLLVQLYLTYYGGT